MVSFVCVRNDGEPVDDDVTVKVIAMHRESVEQNVFTTTIKKEEKRISTVKT